MIHCCIDFFKFKFSSQYKLRENGYFHEAAQCCADLSHQSRSDTEISLNMVGNNLVVSNKVKHLGHFITDKMTDDDDIYRQRCEIYAQVTNILARRFRFCSDAVKTSLFKAYCTPLYTAHLWSNYKKASMQRLQVAYNDALRILLKRPGWCSASELCQCASIHFKL